MRRTLPRTLLMFAALLVIGALALPTSLGGVTSYVTTYGDSMAPRFHAGDLAIARAADSYQVGDVVVYHSDMMNVAVMHRIVKIDNGRYTFQGDNNGFLDPETPTQDDLIGKLAVRVPQGGVWLERGTNPVFLALVVLVLAGIGGTAVQTRRKRRRRIMAQHSHQRRLASLRSPDLSPRAKQTATGLLVCGLVGMLLAYPAWSRPVSQTEAVTGSSDATMTFSYSTTVSPSAAYDDTHVTSPDPVFRRLADTVDVHYAYSGEPGRITLAAKLSTLGGWHSTIPLSPTVGIDDDESSGTVRLDLDALQQRADAAAKATGIAAAQVDVSVIARVRDGERTFAPELPLVLTPLQLSLSSESTGMTVTDSTPTAGSTRSTPATLSILNQEVPVTAARLVSALLIVVALLGALLLALTARRTAPVAEGLRIRRRYAPILIDVEPMPTPANRPVVDVVDFATLAKLAERYGLLVMHWQRSEVDTFVVQDEGITYRYRTGTELEGSPRAGALSADESRQVTS